MLDVVGLWYEDLGWLPLALACLGLYLGLRLSGDARPPLVSRWSWCGDAPARAWLGPVRANPDMLGYLAPSYMAHRDARAHVAWARWRGRGRTRRRRQLVRARVAFLVPLCALAFIPETSARASLATFTATDDLDDLRVRQLPPRAVVLESSPQTVFRSVELQRGGRRASGSRARAAAVSALPERAQRSCLPAQPALAALVAAICAPRSAHATPAPLLRSRARGRCSWSSTRASIPALYPLLAPRGVYAQVATRRSQPTADLRCCTLAHAGLGAQQHETETARQLLWIHYMNAVQLGAHADRLSSAREALARALALQPTEQRLPALRDALDRTRPSTRARFCKF